MNPGHSGGFRVNCHRNIARQFGGESSKPETNLRPSRFAPVKRSGISDKPACLSGESGCVDGFIAGIIAGCEAK